MGIDARTDVYHGDDRVGRIIIIYIGTARRAYIQQHVVCNMLCT